MIILVVNIELARTNYVLLGSIIETKKGLN